MKATAAAALLALAAAADAGAAGMAAPYVDVSLDTAAAEPLFRAPPGRGPVIWAFATGDCAAERWGAFDSARFAALNVAAFVAAGRPYIVSTGGEAGGFHCDSDEAFAGFVARHDSAMLAGVDFDIERNQSPAQIDALAARAAWLERTRPALRLSFTLATHAGSDAARRHLNATGREVLAAMQRHRLQRAIVNLMVMNYGPADARWCVLRPATAGAPVACDMGRSGLQAARNLQRASGLPFGRIAVTAMLGENDVAGNVFTPADARVLREGAVRLGLAGLHWWSAGRDRPCAEGRPRVSPRCHGLAGVAAGEFGTLLAPTP